MRSFQKDDPVSRKISVTVAGKVTKAPLNVLKTGFLFIRLEETSQQNCASCKEHVENTRHHEALQAVQFFEGIHRKTSKDESCVNMITPQRKWFNSRSTQISLPKQQQNNLDEKRKTRRKISVTDIQRFSQVLNAELEYAVHVITATLSEGNAKRVPNGRSEQ